MAPSREIEKLQRRWQDNPLGLTFAPLAEAYRKEAMFADALELLAIGLTQHPNYVPAHIVRGRCFLDAADERSAEESFEKVIELDPENVIALKALADIGERQGRFAEAAARLERVLEVDHANDEARLQYERLRLAGVGAATVPAAAEGAVVVDAPAEIAPPAAVPAPAEAESPTFEPMSVAEYASWAAPVDALPEAPLARATEPADEVEPRPSGPAAAIGAEVRDDVEVELYHPIELSAAPESEYRRPGDSDALADRVVTPTPTPSVDATPAGAEAPPVSDDTASVTAESATAAEPMALEGDLPIPIEPPPEPAGPSTPTVVEDSVEVEVVMEEVGVDEVVPADETDLEAVGADQSPELEEEPASLEQDDADAVAGVEAEPELVVTETMAEVFLRQGHRDLALAVYLQLASREPDNVRIRGAIDSLEGERRASAPSLPAFAAVLTGGQSVRAFFEQLLSASRPAPVAEAPRGELSLGAVFGEEGPPVEPVPAASEAGPSFDEFYSGVPVPDDPATAPAEGPGEETAAADLETFTNWLKGLKR